MNDWELSSRDKSAFRRKLLTWFEREKRDLPWRHNKTPYRIWISEIMLQQTQVATVIDYYKRFMRAFPNIIKLAQADESEVLKLWEGLGYYRRARQLHSAARVVVEQHHGQFPDSFDEVLALPGIGRYTAGAILSISADQPHPILEGNTVRLYSRLMLLEEQTTTSQSQKELWKFAEHLVPRKRAGDVNQALMELGNRVCKPRNPLCTDCAVRLYCRARAEGKQKLIPLPKRPPKYEDIHEAAIVVKRSDKYLVRECQPGERWAGLWDFPRFEVTSTDVTSQLVSDLKGATGLTVSLVDLKQTIKHAVTRFRITLDCFEAKSIRGQLKGNTFFRWVDSGEVEELAFSVTGRKIAKTLR